MIAYGVDTQGSEFYTVSIRNIETGEEVAAQIDDCYGSFEWSEDGKSIFWVRRDQNARPDAVFERNLETGEDTLIYEEKTPASSSASRSLPIAM